MLEEKIISSSVGDNIILVSWTKEAKYEKKLSDQEYENFANSTNAFINFKMEGLRNNEFLLQSAEFVHLQWQHFSNFR